MISYRISLYYEYYLIDNLHNFATVPVGLRRQYSINNYISNIFDISIAWFESRFDWFLKFLFFPDSSSREIIFFLSLRTNETSGAIVIVQNY